MNKTLILAAALENLEDFQEHGRCSAKVCGLDDKEVYQVELALEEILVNIISYAYPKERKGNIEMICSWRDRQELIIEVVDCGVAFNPLRRPNPDVSLSLEERGIGGMGIFFAKKMMDKVTYERCGGRNLLTLIKRCSR